MLKKLSKNINIENIENKDGGIINFYVGDEKSNVDKKSISIAAVDKYSSPLECEVAISPWGKKHYRVSATVMNPMIGQRVYQKYLTYSDKNKARETMDFIVNVLEEIKDEAEIGLRHSAFLIPKIWKKLSDLSEEAEIGYHDVEDNSISLRFNNNQFDGKDNPIPQGWVGEEPRSTYTQGVAPNIAEIIGAPSQYSNPGRTGVMAKRNNMAMIKISSKKNKIVSRSYVNLFFKISNKKKFTIEEANKIAHSIGIRWNVVNFSVEDFRKGLDVEVEHDNDPQTDVVRDDENKWKSVGKITWRHLKESPDYYKELEKIENRFEKE